MTNRNKGCFKKIFLNTSDSLCNLIGSCSCLYNMIETWRSALLECFTRMHLVPDWSIESNSFVNKKNCGQSLHLFFKVLRMRIKVLFLKRDWFVWPDKIRAWLLFLRGMTRAYLNHVNNGRARIYIRPYRPGAILKTIPLFSN